MERARAIRYSRAIGVTRIACTRVTILPRYYKRDDVGPSRGAHRHRKLSNSGARIESDASRFFFSFFSLSAAKETGGEASISARKTNDTSRFIRAGCRARSLDFYRHRADAISYV